MLSEPFYGHFLAGFQKQTSTQGDAGAPALESRLFSDAELQLICCQPVFAALDKSQQVGALKHEALHLMLGHWQQRAGYVDSARFDLAADLVVNQYLTPAQMPKDGVSLQQINAVLSLSSGRSLLAGQAVGYYYQALDTCMPQLSAAGMVMPQHQQWQAFANLSQSMQQLISQQLDNRLENCAERAQLCGQLAGDLPAELMEKLKQLQARRSPRLNWRRALRLFANNSRRTRIRNTLRRPSRRYGTTPGIKIQPHQRLLVAIDTSASVDIRQLELFFNEIHHIWRAGAEITVVECDTKIGSCYGYRGEMPEAISGRGGTCFDAPVQLANDEGFDGTIYFTDGEGELSIRPRKPLLWLVHNDRALSHIKELQAFGRVIPMTDPI